MRSHQRLHATDFLTEHPDVFNKIRIAAIRSTTGAYTRDARKCDPDRLADVFSEQMLSAA